MLCDKCKKNQAKINLVKIVNGEKHETWLCEECAKNISNMPFFEDLGKDGKAPFQGLLTDILTNIENTVKDVPKKLVCEQCGLTYDEFEKSGILGCSNCYNVFSNNIKNKLEKSQGKTKHVGKIPKINGENLYRKQKLNALKSKLQEYIISEEYENAAIIRDKIKELEIIIKENIIKDKGIELEEEKYNEKLD